MAFPGVSTPSVPSAGGGGGGATPGEVDAFLRNAAEADDLMDQSSWNMVQAVASDAVVKKLKDERDAANKIQDPKEKEAQQRKVRNDTADAAAKVDYDKASKDVEKADAKKKEKVSYSMYNFALAVLKDTELGMRAKNLCSGVPSPAIAPKLPKVKEFASNISNQASNTGKVMAGIKKMMPAAGLKSLPTKASDKPKAVSGD